MVIAVASTAFGLGISPAVALSTDLVVGAVPPERAGAASGMTETSTELGGALGIALIGSVGMAVYRVALSPPAWLPPAALAGAREMLGGALAVAAAMHGSTGTVLAGAAREAFTRGTRISGLISAALLLVLAVGGAVASRRGGQDA